MVSEFAVNRRLRLTVAEPRRSESEEFTRKSSRCHSSNR
ncbi:MAG: hypothetical protein ACI9DC_004417 [Gammaproteobacteria bacterium]|jgi:hypothetical protein